ncbi:MAG: methyltransferase domain-containing protein [Candidatus Cloacimonetes bacterium]|nr:methyltransferase domain-containing protein [Candidatus Cloacimonadota bacterium]
MKIAVIREKILQIKFLFTSDVVYQGRMWWLMNILPSGNGRRLVDFGCGNGFAVNWAAYRGWRATGISYEQKEVTYARQMSSRLKQEETSFFIGDLRHIGQVLRNEEKFDAALCLEVIEHIRNDRKLIAEISQHLLPGGKLFLTTPNENYKHLIGDTVSEIEDGGHIRWGYTLDELNNMFRGAGLRIVQRGEIIGFVYQMITNLERLASRLVGRKLSWALTFPLRFFLPLDRVVTDIIKYPYLSLWVVAVKT